MPSEDMALGSTVFHAIWCFGKCRIRMIATDSKRTL
jgi:hypothetical protein